MPGAKDKKALSLDTLILMLGHVFEAELAIPPGDPHLDQSRERPKPNPETEAKISRYLQIARHKGMEERRPRTSEVGDKS